MNLSSVLKAIRSLPAYRELLAAIEGRRPFGAPLQLPRAARPPVAAALAEDVRRPVLMIVPRADRLLSLTEELSAWAPGLAVFPFPDPNPLFFDRGPWGPRTIQGRAAGLAALAQPRAPTSAADGGVGRPGLYLATARGVMTRTVSPQTYQLSTRLLGVGDRLRLDSLLEHLVFAGYEPDSVVTQTGQFSRRGGILDLWPPSEARPVRVELFGDEVDTMRRFDPSTQRSEGTFEQLRVPPAREGLPGLYREAWEEWAPAEPVSPESASPTPFEFFLPLMETSPAGLLDFLPEDAVLLADDRVALEDAVTELEEQTVALRREKLERGELSEDFPIPYLTLTEINETLDERGEIDFGLLGAGDEEEHPLASRFSPGPRFGGQLKPLMEFLALDQTSHEITIVVSRQAERLAELWSEDGTRRPVTSTVPETLLPGALHFIEGGLGEGWQLELQEGGELHLLTDAEVFGWAAPRPRRRTYSQAAAPESAYADLSPADWVVHVDYGIGQFRGLVERTIDGNRREYLLIQYGGGDQVFVPIHQADRVTRYVGADGTPPSASRLGTQEWERAKSQAEHAVEEIARDLLQLYAERMTVEGYAFSPDAAWQHELEASFPYVETEDQLNAIRAVKADMERAKPMDRLICGDAGYGKTEVALRAAFKAVMDGRQVALLVPTTVLAQQHYNTFRQRLAAFPVEAEMLSRFRTRAEAEVILKRLARGEIDIVIGTHRLLQKDVRFKDLGLLIIDEEQRFGVTHKEYLKKMRTNVDVLTMTATPIPRTLYMALTGARDISTINTPPEERLPVVTHVGAYDPQLIRRAVLRELDRGGQVFFVHNRVQTIGAMQRRLERLAPEARLAVAHGQMNETELSQVMDRFGRGEIDVLISTSIIESGLDFPNANTLIVDRADMFGLAQLYQLRGRVGRGASRGYAYFFRHAHRRSTEDAAQRLEIIAEHSELGAGYSIAMRDLEMRGAGDFLGTRQHGHIVAVGFHLYTRLLSQAIQRIRAGYGDLAPKAADLPFAVEPLEVSIDLPLPGAIPADYVPDRELRLQLYRRMAEMRSDDEIEVLRGELEDRFGQPPREVDNLLYQLRVKLLAARASVLSVTAKSGQILLALPQHLAEAPRPDLGPGVRHSKSGLWLTGLTEPDWTDRLVEVLTRLAKASVPA